MLRLLLVLLCALPAQSRLRTDVIPKEYHLNLNLTSGLDNPSNSYTGNVSILLNITADVQNFTFHASGLQILNTSLFYEIRVGIDSIKHDTSHTRIIGSENVTIASEGIYKPGNYTLVVAFEGKFGGELDGFYRSSYKVNQITRWMASTHFEAQGARKAFPCFDEPSMRAKLILELTLPSDLHAVSNMPISSSSVIENGWKRVRFSESPSMPTYLMAWFVGDSTFLELHTRIVNGTTYNVYGRVDLKEQGEYAFNVTPRVIAGLESFTGVKYSSSGMSLVGQVAIPDFSAGAMENWGLVTYREAYLMYDPNVSSVLDKQHALLVIAHELAHQWFGNAVTLDWWSYTWLNEGFARYLQYVITNKLEPDWMVEHQFVTDVIQLSMAADLDAHPLTNPNVTSENEIEDMFDVVTYGKGASILRMFSSILGEEAFKGWINTYLTSVIEKGRVATPNDLFAALSNQTLAMDLKPWTEVSGHPVVHVSTRPDDRGLISLYEVKENITENRLPMDLKIPIKCHVKINDSVSELKPLGPGNVVDLWLSKTVETLRLANSKDSQLIPEYYLINVNYTGYYKVQYDEANYIALRNGISRNELSPSVRAQLVSDALSLMMTGYLQPRVALDFVKFLENEKDLLVWKAALMAFREIRDHLLGWPVPRDAIDSFVKNTMDKAMTLTNIVESQDRHYEKVLRMYVTKQACVYRTRLCSSIQLLPREPQTSIESMDRDTDGAVLCELVKTNGSYWEEVFSMYINSQVPTQKARYLTSLSCTVDPSLQSRLLGYMLQPDVIKLQDIKSMFTRILDSDNGTMSAINFIRANGTQFVKQVSSKRDICKMLEAISSKLYTNQMMKEMEEALRRLPESLLTNKEKSDITAKAKKAADRRQLVAKRVCDGFNLLCLPPQDPVSSDEGGAASNIAYSLTVLLVAVAVSLYVL